MAVADGVTKAYTPDVQARRTSEKCTHCAEEAHNGTPSDVELGDGEYDDEYEAYDDEADSDEEDGYGGGVEVEADAEFDESQLDAAYELELEAPSDGDGSGDSDDEEALPRVHWTGNMPFGEYTPHDVVSVSDARCQHEVRVEAACGLEECLDFLRDWQAVSACFDLVDTVCLRPLLALLAYAAPAQRVHVCAAAGTTRDWVPPAWKHWAGGIAVWASAAESCCAL